MNSQFFLPTAVGRMGVLDEIAFPGGSSRPCQSRSNWRGIKLLALRPEEAAHQQIDLLPQESVLLFPSRETLVTILEFGWKLRAPARPERALVSKKSILR